MKEKGKSSVYEGGHTSNFQKRGFPAYSEGDA